MGRIEDCFSLLRAHGKKAFVAYITAGDPSLKSTIQLVHEFESQGVDIVELGIPFSDPIADGPVNQEAAMRALKNNVSLDQIFEMVRDIRKKSEIPLVFFAYLNTIFAYGFEKFVSDAGDAGVDGVLILDLPPEEATDYKKHMDAKGIATIFLVSPITPDNRLDIIVKYASGFVYYVSQMGVTGERSHIAEDIPMMTEAIRARTTVPIVVGFGISTPDQVRKIACYADGVVVGSSIVRRIGESYNQPGFETGIALYVGTLTAPLQGE